MCSVDKFLPLLYEDANQYENILLGGINPLISEIEKDTNTEIHVTPYIQPWVLKGINTEKAQWKLRQPLFRRDAFSPDYIFKQLRSLKHLFYKRITAINKEEKTVTKIYSVEARKNYALIFQGDAWAQNIREINKYTTCIPKLLQWLPNFHSNVHVAVFEYIPGVPLKKLYSYPGKQFDTGHPDVITGKLAPYWGNIDSVPYEHIIKVKSIIERLYYNLYEASQLADLTGYQQLDNEPDWEGRWLPPHSKMVWHIDDWSLQNIIEAEDGEYRAVKLDRAVVCDINNATVRLMADLRNQTNIRWKSKNQIIKKLQ